MWTGWELGGCTEAAAVADNVDRMGGWSDTIIAAENVGRMRGRTFYKHRGLKQGCLNLTANSPKAMGVSCLQSRIEVYMGLVSCTLHYT